MSGRVRVTKMSGAGNDFVVIGPDALTRLGDEPRDWIRRVCRRGLSVGADGVLLVEPLGDGRIHVRFRNPDGSAAFCGNGTRCAARFAYLEGLAGESMRLVTDVGEVHAELRGDQVCIELPAPQDRGPFRVAVADEIVVGRFVVAGVPHALVEVTEVQGCELERWGPALRRHADFGAAGANVDVVATQADGSLAIRTWERGVEGETLSCGSGALAVAFLAYIAGGPASIRVIPASGVELTVEFDGPAEAPTCVRLIGDARRLFVTELEAEATCGFSVV